MSLIVRHHVVLEKFKQLNCFFSVLNSIESLHDVPVTENREC